MKISKQLKGQLSIWIELAQSDLRATRILHLTGEYRTAYFLFQQSVEKANKAFALLNGMTEKDLLNIGHKQLEIFKVPLQRGQMEVRDLVEKLNVFRNTNGRVKFENIDFSDYTKSINVALSYINDLITIDLVNIPTQDIHWLLDEIYRLDDIKYEIPHTFDEDTMATLLSAIDFAKHLGFADAVAHEKEVRKFFSDRKNVALFHSAILKTFQTVQPLMFIQLTFFVCAIFTAKHSTLPRYPNNGQNPIKIYTKKLPLIRQQNEIMDVFEEALKKFKRFTNSLK